MRWRQWMPSSSFLTHFRWWWEVKGVVSGGSRKALRWGLQLVKHNCIPNTHWALGLYYIRHWVGTTFCQRRNHRLSLLYRPFKSDTSPYKNQHSATQSWVLRKGHRFHSNSSCGSLRSIDAPDFVFIHLQLICLCHILSISKFLFTDFSVSVI